MTKNKEGSIASVNVSLWVTVRFDNKEVRCKPVPAGHETTLCILNSIDH